MAGAGREMHRLIADLYPICRSITGNGVRETLKRLQGVIPLETREVPSGTKVFDWVVPKEWNIRDAWIKNARGEKLVDFQKSNLHVLSYSVPVRKTVTLSELKEHVFTLPDHPDWIPYRTSYYREAWGFCMGHRPFQALRDETYEVCIDSTLENGSLTYGEYLLSGATKDEVLISCHVCHPSLANDNLSGIALAAFLARHLQSAARRYSYRFLFLPGTIGSITWLAQNESRVDRIKHGLVVACVGDAGRPTYKRSRQGDAEIDGVVEYVLGRRGGDYRVAGFSPYGYDERQYNSPGFNLPVGCLMRTPHGEYPEYHTSADNLDFVKADALAGSLALYLEVIEALESNRKYRNLNPKCEPQLGRRGLYDTVGGAQQGKTHQLAMLWVLNLSDGRHGLLDIAARAGLPHDVIRAAAERLLENHLLKPCNPE